MQGIAAAEKPHETFKKLFDTAWKQLENMPLKEISLVETADLAGIDHSLAFAVSGDIQKLILAKVAELDDAAIYESFIDIKDAGDISFREKILEGLMHRFEVYAPYRAQIVALNRAACRRPDLALALMLGLQAVTRRIMIMAGDPCDGWQGLVRNKGVVGVVLIAARVWMKDDTLDLAPTMKELDRRLQQAEEWGLSLRVFRNLKHSDVGANNNHSDVSTVKHRDSGDE